MTKFEDLGLRSEILEAVAELGYENPMPVQAQVIPQMLEGERDIVALAQTGTGKTAAFGLPLLSMVNENENKVQALILSPTRELCIQIARDLENYASKLRKVRVVPVYGGEQITIQLRKLKTPPQILVATPGRLIDLMERGRIQLNHSKYLVLDEADEMLNMGFQEDLEKILTDVPEGRRTLLFSATMPREISRISKKYMNDAQEIEVGTRNSGSENVEHVYYTVRASDRYKAIKRIVDVNPNIFGIVFCRTRQETKDVAEKLMADGYNADALHGDLSQAQRDTVMGKFRKRHLQILVATDVAARGLDVSDLTHVINYNLPDDVEIYTHRSGRTGRANKKGVSIVICTNREQGRIRSIERMIKKQFTQGVVPTGSEICKTQLFHLLDKMQQVEINEEEINPFMEEIQEKLVDLSKEDILKKFVSLEFNRFLKYYDGVSDLVVDDGRGNRRGDRNDRGGRGGRRGDRTRLKISIGHKQNADPRRILGILNDVTNDKTISVGDIEITNKFSFFDVFSDQADKVLTAFQSGDSNVEVSIARPSERSGGGDRRRSGGGGRAYGNRSYGSRDGGGDRRNSRRSDDRRDRSYGGDKRGGNASRNTRSSNSEKPWRSHR